MVESTSPRLVLPCDDTALRLLMLLALSPPAMLPPALHLQLAALIVDSLGDPAFYRTSIDKTMIGPAAAALGVRVPASIVVSALDDAKRFIAAHGFPIVIKRSHSTAGEGVALCADQAIVDREFARLMATPALDLDDLAAGQIVLQEFIAGTIHFYTAVAWRGALVSGVAVEKIEGERKGRPARYGIFAHRKCMRPRRASRQASASPESFRPNSSLIRREASRISSRSTDASRTARIAALE